MENSHKGSFGKTLIIGGSPGMSGAVSLAGLGALRGGAGLVYLAVPHSIQQIVAATEPSYLTIALPTDEQGLIAGDALATIDEQLPRYNAVAAGPGIGRSAELTTLIQSLYCSAANPMVIDADGLNALADSSVIKPELVATENCSGTLPKRTTPPDAPRILTPHPGEFSRLIGDNIENVENHREELAARYAKHNRVVLVLKGHRTIITDGEKLAINTTGNNGMATGGSGDVLTGLLTTLLGQNMPAFEAAQLAVHLHGLAGDIAAEELSQPGMIASDLPHYLPAAWKRFGKAAQ